MKYITSFCALLVMVATSAVAQVEFTITGATAFRAATLATLVDTMDTENGPGNYVIVHNDAPGDVTSSDYAAFKGDWPGIGPVIIKTFFDGSVAGLQAVAQGVDPTFYTTAYINTLPNGETANVTGNLATEPADSSFSDVSIQATPFADATLAPAQPQVGVVTFTPIMNVDGDPDIDNLTFQQFRAIWTTGSQPLSILTGDPNDATGHAVYAVGRNDGSGTRTTYLAEAQYGVSNLVVQWFSGEIAGGVIRELYIVPAGGVVPGIEESSASNASTVWGQDVDGNGGSNSGGNLRTTFASQTNALGGPALFAPDGTQIVPEGAQEATLLTVIGTGDASRITGVKVLGWNGVTLEGLKANPSGGLTQADIDKVTSGQYTLWNPQYFYYVPGISADEITIYNDIVAGIPNNLGTSGIALSDMDVSRAGEGLPVAP